ncbi:larval cuticle protein A2B [Tribolium castaneum]|uniref:Pupal cuticle protein Edg-84A-like Protein n=1 Tax=Tribolium castaneum TaxID=7070 RepID=D6WRT4_TRICA|nr:PREDICTED: larval cuticle protein A2B [Tribolium castaneum]XP_015837592.1 PREDICTED: larval cuticle protein A2B [Tribolium castaneum]EFA05952.1 Pupal cuticle protein Edg-84A-like Protein [Tribolium castaneum]|eukprot:XP_008196014.1 PREDICTED: larval cuticle protein A2B [Tribolium castaneum]
MALKKILLAISLIHLSVAEAENLPYSHLVRIPSASKIVNAVIQEPATTRPHYNFNYQVQDPYSGDRKSQVEVRHGNVVQGSYSLIEPDGTRRIVDYYADPISGFKAEVRKEILNNKLFVNSNDYY